MEAKSPIYERLIGDIHVPQTRFNTCVIENDEVIRRSFGDVLAPARLVEDARGLCIEWLVDAPEPIDPVDNRVMEFIVAIDAKLAIAEETIRTLKKTQTLVGRRCRILTVDYHRIVDRIGGRQRPVTDTHQTLDQDEVDRVVEVLGLTILTVRPVLSATNVVSDGGRLRLIRWGILRSKAEDVSQPPPTPILQSNPENMALAEVRFSWDEHPAYTDGYVLQQYDAEKNEWISTTRVLPRGQTSVVKRLARGHQENLYRLLTSGPVGLAISEPVRVVTHFPVPDEPVVSVPPVVPVVPPVVAAGLLTPSVWCSPGVNGVPRIHWHSSSLNAQPDSQGIRACIERRAAGTDEWLPVARVPAWQGQHNDHASPAGAADYRVRYESETEHTDWATATWTGQYGGRPNRRKWLVAMAACLLLLLMLVGWWLLYYWPAYRVETPDVAVMFGGEVVPDFDSAVRIKEPVSTPNPDPTPKPDVVIVPKPDPTPRPDVVIVPKPDPTPRPDVVIVPKPDPTPKPDVVIVPKPDPTPKTDVVIVPRPNPTPKPDVVIVPKPDPTPKPDVVIVPKPDPTPKPDVVIVPKPDPTPKPDVVIVPKPDPTPKPDVVIVPKPDPTPKPDAVIVPKPDPMPKPPSGFQDFEGGKVIPDAKDKQGPADPNAQIKGIRFLYPPGTRQWFIPKNAGARREFSLGISLHVPDAKPGGPKDRPLIDEQLREWSLQRILDGNRPRVTEDWIDLAVIAEKEPPVDTPVNLQRAGWQEELTFTRPPTKGYFEVRPVEPLVWIGFTPEAAEAGNPDWWRRYQFRFLAERDSPDGLVEVPRLEGWMCQPGPSMYKLVMRAQDKPVKGRVEILDPQNGRVLTETVPFTLEAIKR